MMLLSYNVNIIQSEVISDQWIVSQIAVLPFQYLAYNPVTLLDVIEFERNLSIVAGNARGEYGTRRKRRSKVKIII